MAVHPRLPVGGFLFLWRIPFAVLTKGPSPSGGYHHRLQVVIASKALRHGAIVPGVVVHLLTSHWPSGDEVLKRLLGERPRMPWPSSQV
jgi:hypothetical protein